MQLPANVEDVLDGKSSVESECLEFKQGWNPLAVIHTLCAFANDFNNLDGGYIFIGIAEENGKPILPPEGLDSNSIDKIQKELVQYGHDKIRPAYHPIAAPYEISGKTVLVLRASGGQNRPYKAVDSLAKDNKLWNYYIRKLSYTVKAREADETELYQSRTLFFRRDFADSSALFERLSGGRSGGQNPHIYPRNHSRIGKVFKSRIRQLA